MAAEEIVSRTVRIGAPVEVVFSFLTDGALMPEWAGAEVELDPRPGGIFRVRSARNLVVRGRFVAVEPPSRVVFTWGWEDMPSLVPPGSSTVEITLAPDGDGTVLHLTHSGLPAEQREFHDAGWERYLARLAVAAAGGDPGRDPFIEKPGAGSAGR